MHRLRLGEETESKMGTGRQVGGFMPLLPAV